MNAEQIGKNIARWREARGMTQRGLYKASGVTVNMLEAGSRTPRIEALAKIAAALSVPIAVLLDGVVAEEVKPNVD
jgi:transcriptional regulator with XRE-family HTH domain